MAIQVQAFIQKHTPVDELGHGVEYCTACYFRTYAKQPISCGFQHVRHFKLKVSICGEVLIQVDLTP